MKRIFLMFAVLFIFSSCESSSESKRFYEQVNRINNEANDELEPFLQVFFPSLESAIDQKKFPDQKNSKLMLKHLKNVEVKVDEVLTKYKEMEEFDNEIPLLKTANDYYIEIDRMIPKFKKIIDFYINDVSYEELNTYYLNEYKPSLDTLLKHSDEYKSAQNEFVTKYDK